MVADRVTGFGKAVNGIQKVLKPRTDSRKDHEIWDDELRDYAAANGLVRMHSLEAMPTIAEIAGQVAVDKTKSQTLLEDCIADWKSQNTRWFYIVRDSLDLSGAYETIDRRMIKDKFTGSDGLRDGQGLLVWAKAQPHVL